MGVNLNNCGTVKYSYFSSEFVDEILLTCESDAFPSVYHVCSIVTLLRDNTINFTDRDKQRVHNLEKNNYVWLRFKQ